MTQYVNVECQRFLITNGGVVYPYFLGAADAKQLIKIAEAPSFEVSTEHQYIAKEVLAPPTTHWQRPTIQKKIDEISRKFDLVGELMPNPVLLAVNPQSKIEVKRQVLANGMENDLWTVSVPVHSDSAQKPLWIIDGQHRLKGMALTQRINSPLPFVLLYSEEGVYVPGTLAKIFAQVSTEATRLDPIHSIWMQFVFELGEYANHSNKWRAIKTVATLCAKQHTFDGKPNPFYGTIQFNPIQPAKDINPHGFAYTSEELMDLIEKWFFTTQGGQHHFTEEELAEQIALAVIALKACVKKNVDSSAFFGSSGEQKYFRDGYIIGILNYLLANGEPNDWVEILKDLKFHVTPWDVSDWVNGTSGKAGNVSKKIAEKAFSEVFIKGKLPEKVTDFCDYLSGSNAFLTLEYLCVDDSNEILPGSKQIIQIPLTGGDKIVKELPVDARQIKITSPCKNVGPVEIKLADKPFAKEYDFSVFSKKKGKLLEKAEIKQMKNKVVLKIRAELYGDNSLQKQLTLTFNG